MKKVNPKIKKMKIILGDICYPKSEALIIPANTVGTMTKGIPLKVVKSGKKVLFEEVKQIISINKIEVGGFFVTGPGRLKRRGTKKIYHCVIKRLQSDFTSLHIVREALGITLQKVVNDGMKSVTVCGIGIEQGDLDEKSVARITVEMCEKVRNLIEVKIIDDNVNFVKEVERIWKESYECC